MDPNSSVDSMNKPKSLVPKVSMIPSRLIFPRTWLIPNLGFSLFAVIERWATDFVLKPGGPHQAKVGDDLYEFETVIFANGAAARWLNAPGEEKYVNKGISACATCDGPLPVFRKKHLFVVGGGDTAIEGSTTVFFLFSSPLVR